MFPLGISVAYSKNLITRQTCSKDLLEKSNLLEICVCTCGLSRLSSVVVKIHQVLIRQTSQISRVLNLNCSADLSKRRVIKVSKPLALTIEISKPLTLANESRNLLSWQIINQLIQPTSLNSAQWGIKNSELIS